MKYPCRPTNQSRDKAHVNMLFLCLYICEAVEILSVSKENPKIVDGVYNDIATKFGATKSRVERAIRHAISKIDVYAWNNYGGSGLRNSEFLYTLALKINQED